MFNERFAGEEDELLIDRLFPQVRLSTVSSALIRDTRDDPIAPGKGSLIGMDAEVVRVLHGAREWQRLVR